ncbi:MAG: hypothetical protein HY699_03285, partial [Deltaproteobacteria bacterium]|nr:hypothetical protein [Deltaproteobacteria bacterium]
PDEEQVPAFPGPSHNAGESSVFGSCALCHNDLATTLLPLHDTLPCDTCHEELLPGVYGPGHQSRPGADQVPSFSGPAHALGSEARFGECGYCHNELAVRLTAAGAHGSFRQGCQRCHTAVLPGEYRPMHESVPRCLDCHREQRTHHDPGAGAQDECTICHDPHGTGNLFLINERVLTPSGARTVEFSNDNGLADGSFADASAPGSGICETCHRVTRYFRSDGTGAAHISQPCTNCHTHAAAFVALPTATPTGTPTPSTTPAVVSTVTPTPTATPASG